MLDVDARPGEARQLEVAGDADFLAAGRDSRDTQPVGAGTFVHRAATAQFRDFAMAGGEKIEVTRVFQRATEKIGIGHRVAVVGDHHRTLTVHVGDVGQLLSGAALGDATRRPDGNGGLLAGQSADEADKTAGVDGRIRVRHGDNAGESAAHRGAPAGCDGLFVLTSGFAQVDVHVEKTGQKDFSRAIDDLGADRRSDLGGHFFDFSPGRNEKIKASRRGMRGVDGLSAAEKSWGAHDVASSFSSGRGATAGCNQ